MSNLDLPPYIINMPFITAIRKDCIEYIQGVVKKTPCMATALYYVVDEHQALCMFDGVVHYPIILLMTPFAFAMLFNSKRVLRFFMQTTNTMNAPCYIADSLDPQGVWYNQYRLIEFSPLFVRRPNPDLYNTLREFQFNFNGKHTLKCTTYEKKRKVRENAMTAESPWEALWCVWNEFRNPAIMLDCSSELFIAGCDVRKLAARIDLSKLLTECRSTRTSNTHIAYFLQLTIFHGVDLQVSDVLANYLNAILQLTTVEGCNDTVRKNLFISVYNLGGDRCLDYEDVIKTLQKLMRIATLPIHDQRSLQMTCVRRIRQILPGSGFYSTVWKMKLLNESSKRVLMTGLIKHKQPPQTTEEIDAQKQVKTPWKVRKSKLMSEVPPIQNGAGGGEEMVPPTTPEAPLVPVRRETPRYKPDEISSVENSEYKEGFDKTVISSESEVPTYRTIHGGVSTTSDDGETE
ncbi:unnamed protein product [Mesocestoides corti]|uniref:Envelope glycoprotein L n=1 Tax=Mesocestoides corti TaxID=53468 RepID=A0A0R3UPA0_MESCO|nr:unnamed protein product [Mesocestoides corti]